MLRTGDRGFESRPLQRGVHYKLGWSREFGGGGTFRALVPGRNFREGTTNRTNESLNPATAGAVFRSAGLRLHCGTRSIVEPDLFHAPAIEDAVRRQGHAFDVRLPASGTAPIEDDRPGAVFRQFSFDLPHQVFALPDVGFRGLLETGSWFLRA